MGRRRAAGVGETAANARGTPFQSTSSHYDYGSTITKIGLPELPGRETCGGDFLGEGLSEFCA